jgi:hypothetical protein
MRYVRYPYSCTLIRRAIRKKYRGAGELCASATELSALIRAIKRTTNNADAELLEGVLANHLLWMLDHLQKLENSDQGISKQGRWMGWVYAHCEWLGLFTQRQIRNMARRDSSKP